MLRVRTVPGEEELSSAAAGDIARGDAETVAAEPTCIIIVTSTIT